MLIVEVDPFNIRMISALNNGVFPEPIAHPAGGRDQQYLVMEPNKPNRFINSLEFKALRESGSHHVEATQRRMYWVDDGVWPPK
jgi:hypothetical protein